MMVEYTDLSAVAKATILVVWPLVLAEWWAEIHIHSINNNNKTWLGFFLLYLRQNIKPYTSYGLGLELENFVEK